jgi:glutamyl-tRNA reductase
MTIGGRPTIGRLPNERAGAERPRADEATREPDVAEPTTFDTQTRDDRADAVADAIHETASEVKRRQLRQAVDALEANGGLTDGQRQAVKRLADRLVEGLLAPPTASLRTAATGVDAAELSTALRLFDAVAEVADE